MEVLLERLQAEKAAAEHAFTAAVFDSERFQTDALAGQLRAAVQLAAVSSAQGH